MRFWRRGNEGDEGKRYRVEMRKRMEKKDKKEREEEIRNGGVGVGEMKLEKK